VKRGIEAWEAGEFEVFGKLMEESGTSSVECYEVGTKPLIYLQGLLNQHQAVYGARFSGAGTRGACVALVRPELAYEAASDVVRDYRKAFPELSCLCSAHICDTGNSACCVRAETFLKERH